MERKQDWVWIVAYINRDYVDSVENDLVVNGFSAVKVFIPTIRVLKKQFKNKNIYDYVPLLFNYGFFHMPYKQACEPQFLRELREKIPVIYAWVKDPIKTLKTAPKLRMDNKGVYENERVEMNTELAIVTEEEISNLLKTSEHLSVFSDSIADKLRVGEFLILKGYPYEGMPAEIVKIDKVNKKIKVKLLLECVITEATVHYENIFYTVYSDYTKGARESSLDELEEGSNRRIDKLYAQINFGNEGEY